MDKEKRIEELVALLNRASEAYYGGREEIMTNYEWDAGFDELRRLEEETGYILPDSPTVTVSDSAEGSAENGQKEPHEYPALSLAKTKKISDLQKWAEDKLIWLSWKLDGLTLVLTYDKGELVKILTRGNGSIGTNITYMKTAINGFPLRIPYKGHVVIRGEATISYPEFERINAELDDDEEKYANPRNLASGTLALDEKNLDIVKQRALCFNAFTLVHTDEEILSWGSRMDLLRKWKFTTVDYEITDAKGLPDAIDRWTKKVENGEMPIPVDGLVISYDDTEYAATGSVTGHHATRAGYAFKWQDASAQSVLDHIEWSCAASTITPVAVFEPVQLEGTTVSRASLCNISELERLGIGENGKTVLQVIKANKIIPKCVAVVKKEGEYTIPDACPVCGAATEIFVSVGGTKTLRCTDRHCPAKKLKKFERFVSKNAMDIDGISIETLRDFTNAHFIRDMADIFSLSDFAEEIRVMEGYGEKSCANLLAAIEKSRNVHPVNFIMALSIPLIGRDAAKKIIAALGWQGFLTAMQGEGFEEIDGIGKERSGAILEWYAEEENRALLEKLLERVNVKNVAPSVKAEGSCSGLTFCITGELHIYENRDGLKAVIEEKGGKTTGAVSKKTSYLITNDTESGSSKNLKAKELNIPIISEEQFVELFVSTPKKKKSKKQLEEEAAPEAQDTETTDAEATAEAVLQPPVPEAAEEAPTEPETEGEAETPTVSEAAPAQEPEEDISGQMSFFDLL